MSSSAPPPPAPEPPPENYLDAEAESRIYFLPNLMTAGNLFCGFVAVIRCIQARFASSTEGAGAVFADTIASTPKELYEQAVLFILAAVLFDALDGRMARLTQKTSLFGKEFDSIADVVSFGMAPALMVFFLILSPTVGFPLVRTLGGLVGFFYLLCCAVRLARFNVITSPLLRRSGRLRSEDFLGLPSPAAAGTVSSIVLVINRTDIPESALFLPILLVLIALLMVSNVRYPSFKRLSVRTRVGLRPFIFVILVVVAVYHFRSLAIAAVFLGYIGYGLWMHFFRGGWREPELDEDPSPAHN